MSVFSGSGAPLGWQQQPVLGGDGAPPTWTGGQQDAGTDGAEGVTMDLFVQAQIWLGG